ncbi:3-hydroxyacyl-CoA dehydrogenase NAD-binding domain-containing protein, partial [Klebsiella oxytoca]|uniref:3-hydroxyacyl-CoA dehydrogenase NAD-binding domain-containing protein n=1 Tax=Klebsiella oxytoca TaxID=571 RepID=UPI001D0F17E5
MSKTLPTVAVIGSGTMGAGIAEVAAAAGHPVLIFDIDPEAVVRAIDGIGQRLASRVSPGPRGGGPGGGRGARGGAGGGGGAFCPPGG